MPSPTPNALFPVFLKLEQLQVLLVGGGEVGLAQLTAILGSNPATAVTVVAPALHSELVALAARHPAVRLLARPFAESDLDEADLLFLATSDPTLNQRIRLAATARRLLTCVADTPATGDFYLALGVEPEASVTSPDASPVASRLRAVLEELPDELHALLQNLAVLRRRLGGDFASRVKILNDMTTELAYGPRYESPATTHWRRIATGSLLTFAAFIALNILSYYLTWPQAWAVLSHGQLFYTFVAVGFGAQLIDGMLGMGYGVVSAISLMSLGLSPVAVSASIHTAEMFASGASGYQHYRFGNVNRKLFRVLLLPGIIGSVAGALLLTHFSVNYADYIKPLLAVYLLILGGRIISKAVRRQPDQRRKVRYAGWLAGAGGFLDSFGGGGWGPLVTSTLITTGRTPRFVIGTVSLVEFFVTLASALTFFSLRGLAHWQIVAGLIVGGVAAAPLAARLAGRIPTRWMLLAVGLMVTLWSGWAIYKALPMIFKLLAGV
ncbi:MAG: TSUP family transporter [Janthinobacterium lividum]